MRRIKHLGMVVLLTAVVFWWWPRSTDHIPQFNESSTGNLAQTLAGDSVGWRRAETIREFNFPQDHGPHPDYKTEWWYFTGNLKTENGLRFGYQLTFFRIGLKPGRVEGVSAWRANHIYMAHFALSDVQGKRFHHFERFSRAANRLAGARSKPFAVWLEDWRVSGGDSNFLPLQLQAEQNGIAVSFTLNSDKPVVLQGNQGLSQKSAAPGNASYYYSMTRMPTVGTIRIGDQTYQVSGNSWLDREWSTSALGPDQAGWDWFALQLNDGRELMYYRLRNKDGSVDSRSAGVLVDVEGNTVSLNRNDVQLKVLKYWTSPTTGIRYPIQWQLELPTHQLALQIKSRLPQQEMNLSVRYWEGAVAITGEVGGVEIGGSGYLEMAGYD